MKKFNIFLLTAFLLAAVVFAFSASGHESQYINNYSKNFKTNLYALAIKLGLPQNITSAVPTPEPPPLFTPTPVPTTTPAPPFESQKHSDILTIEKSKMIPVQNSANMKYVSFDGKLFGADKTSVTVFDKSGNVLSTQNVQLSSPILKCSGNYIAAADKGGNRIYLFSGEKLEFTAQTEGNIISADVSDSGDVVLVCEKDYYKGSVVVYNKRGELIYAWNSGSDRILDADISGQSRRLAILTMNLDNNIMTSNVLWCDISTSKTETAAQYSDALMYDAEFIGNELIVIGNDRIAGLNSRGKGAWENKLDAAELKRYKVGDYAACAFDINNMPYIETLDAGGKKRGSVKINIQPDFIDIKGNHIAYNDERILVYTDIDGKKSKSFSCMRDISDIIIVDSSTVAVVYSSSIEFINVK